MSDNNWDYPSKEKKQAYIKSRRQYLRRRHAIDATAVRLYIAGRELEWDHLTLIASGKFTEPPTREECRDLPYPKSKQMRFRRERWHFFAARFNAASPDAPFDIKAAERILRKWQALLNRNIEWEGK